MAEQVVVRGAARLFRRLERLQDDGLVVTGEAHPFGPGRLRAWRRLLPPAVALELQGAGDMPVLEPAQVLPALDRFLTRAATGADPARVQAVDEVPSLSARAEGRRG